MYRNYFKRILDLIISSFSLVVMSPLMLVIGLLVRVKLGKPVIFKQDRPGKNERIFSLYKFRTMTDEKDSNGNVLPDENRLPKFGRILRASSMDELPELLNILKGDMAIVGPRPLLVRYLPYYKKEEKVRHSVRPGLTGLAQVNGRNNVGWDERLKYDAEYVKNISFIGDVKIIINTIVKVLRHSDVASGKQLIMKDLDVERKDLWCANNQT